jgi:anti-anti-sigma regulatory factor
MRWLRAGNKRPKHALEREAAVVVAVTTPLNRETALELRRRIDVVSPQTDVVIDLTAIPAFDSDGADALYEMQAAHPDRRISIVGLRQATARLIGPDVTAPATDRLAAPGGAGWVVRRLRNLVVVQPDDAAAATADGLEDTVATAVADTDAAIIVIDLRGVMHLPVTAVETIAFASSTAALRGQELLVVNVRADAVDALRAAGLSATTFVAPEPFGQSAPFGAFGDSLPSGAHKPPWRTAQQRP